ncbi:unnamed protein product [Ectocarpus sp. CCAP 1310/34]|nr:unnamed protein product [Ectocarpus sp. CCAP 1310/34]
MERHGMEESFQRTTAVGETHPSQTPTGGTHKNNTIVGDFPSESPPAAAPVPALGRPRTPGSVSAVKDGKNLLSAFRRNKRRNRDAIGGGTTSTPPAIPVPQSHVNHSNPSSEGTLPADKSIVDNIVRFQSGAPDLARNLEAPLDASLPQHRRAQAQHDNVGGDGGSVGGDGLTSERNDGEPKSEKDLEVATESRSNGGAVAVACGASGYAAELSAGDEAGDCCGAGDVDDSVATAAAATADADADADTDAATAASKASPPKKDNSTTSEGSPPRPTPEIVRQAARTSQAAFLSSVLPTQNLDFDTANSDSSNPFTRAALPESPPNGRHRSPVVGPGEPGRASGIGGGGVSGLGAAISSGNGVGLTSSDTRAAARWASMRRLEDQGAGLGNAADHQLARALQLCRDLRGLKAGMGGGSQSGHERASRLDALQSTLHGLEEVLSKRRVVDQTARAEAEALGGPASVWSLLNGDEGSGTDKDQTQVSSSGRREGAATGTTTAIGGGSGGWLTGSQLKAFEKNVEARTSIEISALESERRKLRSKVEMFQRQVQLLQRDGAGHSPAPANGSTGKIGGYPAAAAAATSEVDNGAGGRFGAAAGEKRFADLLDARLGEERIVQATLEAELASLRRTIEEKDGLIGALREALRSAATPARGGDAATARAGTLAGHGAAQSSARRRSADGMSTPRSADDHAVVPTRGVLLPRSSDSSRSLGRYHSRSSRFLSAQGPVAAAAAAAAEAAAAVASRHERAGPWSGKSSVHGSRYAATGEDRVEEIRRPRPIGDGNDDADSTVSAVGGVGGASDEVTARSGNTSATTEAGPVATSNGGEHAAAAATMFRNRTGGDFSGRGTAPESAEGNADIISQATAMTSSALRMLWNSAWGMGSRVRLDGGGDVLESPRKAQRQGGSSSHAVLIL